MDGIRFGHQFRALRLRKDMRQEDVGRIAKLSRPLISRIDRGRIENIQLGQLERAAAALGATVDLRLRWNGEQLDRLLDEAHARLVELVVSTLQEASWEVAVEVSFAIWGERGSIDVFAFHAPTGIVLVVEVKSTRSIARAVSPASWRRAAGGSAVVWPACSSSAILRRRDGGSRGSPPRTRRPFRFGAGRFADGSTTRAFRCPGCCSLHTLPAGAL